MSQSSSSIDVHSIIYFYQGEPVEAEDIPAGAEYTCALLNEEESTEYLVFCEGNTALRLLGPAYDGDYLARAQAIWEHASTLENGPEISPGTMITVEFPQETFSHSIPFGELEEGKMHAEYLVDIDPEKGEFRLIPNPHNAFRMEVSDRGPHPIPVKNVYFNQDKAVLGIEYPLLGFDEKDGFSGPLSFVELSESGIQAMRSLDDDGEDWDEEEQVIFPVDCQAQLEEVAHFVTPELVAFVDLEGVPIEHDQIMEHSDYRRHWFHSDQTLAMSELIAGRGIAHTEIINVPQALHQKTLHAYLRRVHASKEAISLDGLRATHYVVLYEPLSQESTPAVPLEAEQSKLHSSIYTLKGVQVVSECMVFDAEGRPIKKMSFGGPGEQRLMYEEIFKCDENGQPVDSEVIHHDLS
ncbi:hypothetical protein HCH_04331 [Hahella chejuensis KCTC 2396]|uniref:Uncharacterized protein n=1 Tax=Hahella chejuensis (strain KCTC 2396) TaxID=349521 RepID=Q2SE87_HAHCH|nr:hypothetical protein [Hahella chejuensis]ABC31037.1 hypothetical protein HCH_04331 [Hahella chejuensis KCTC 2396]